MPAQIALAMSADEIRTAYDNCLGTQKRDEVKQQACAEELLASSGQATIASAEAQKKFNDALENFNLCTQAKSVKSHKEIDCKNYKSEYDTTSAELKAVNQAVLGLKTILASQQKVYLGGEDVTEAGQGILRVSSQYFYKNAGELIGAVIDFLIKLVGTVALVLLVVAGFRLIVAAGNDNAVTKSKDMLKMAVIGLALALLAYVIVAAIRGLIYR